MITPFAQRAVDGCDGRIAAKLRSSRLLAWGLGVRMGSLPQLAIQRSPNATAYLI